jgi:hypothetical protein
MWHRRQHENPTPVIWDADHLTGCGSEQPVIKAPRAADLAASTAD